MSKENKYSSKYASKFPKIHMIINPRTYKLIKTKMKNIYKDMDILSSAESGITTVNSILTRRKTQSTTNLFEVGLTKLTNKQQKNSFCSTNKMSHTNMNKLLKKINLKKGNISSIISLNSSKKENTSEILTNKENKIPIKNIKLNFKKKNIYYFPKTSRYITKNEIFRKE